MRHLSLAGSVLLLSGCASFQVPPTIGDPAQAVSYGYQPLDPASVIVAGIPTGKLPSRDDLLNALPDETMRMAVGKVDGSGSITYGPVGANLSAGQYIVVIDYVKSNTLAIRATTKLAANGTMSVRTVAQSEPSNMMVPVYVGVGLRLTASLETASGGLDLSSLIGIGASAKANKLHGTLVVQTLGITGENVSTALPIPSEISEASIQNAIQAIGTMKAKLYDSKTTIQPRVVGVYNNIGGGTDTINGFISDLLEHPQTLDVPVSRN